MPILPEPEDAAFVRIIDYIPTARVELPYATADNFTGCRIYDFTDAYLRYGTVKKLAKVSEELEKQGIGLIIWDGFRPVAAQTILWENCPDPSFVSHPVTGRRTHCRGNTVDVTLYDLETGTELPVPTGFDHFTSYADRDYSDCSPEAAANALLLERTMEKHGFVPYFAEWWHFEDAVEYPVDEYFDPAVPAVWSANCDETISLWTGPEGEELVKIPCGASMLLQGWEARYAQVVYEGIQGYVMSDCILPAEEGYLEERLNTVQATGVYTYEQMTADLDQLWKQYPEVVSLSSIGTTAQGRDIPVIRIGDLKSKYHVLLQGSIHGREHMTAWLLMAIADYWLEQDILSYGDVCYHIIPMSNPDGVTISQTGTLNGMQQQIYRSDLQKGYTSHTETAYAAGWKANGEGVDPNKNFPAGWELIDDRSEPSSEQYQGTEPFSAAEAAALRDYTLKYDFDTTISYHATGSFIFWKYGWKEPVNTQSHSLAEAVSVVTGYPPIGNDGIDGAGYKDWAMNTLEIPSLTIEVGCEDTPLPEREMYSIFARNYRILPAIARWLQMQDTTE
jgi:D-alanyl-D-alanine dipeptidase